jgi:hypothetical protein
MATTPITWDDVIAIASELSTVAEDTQDAILAYANDALVESMFKPSALKMARVYLAAHMATVNPAFGGSAIGPIVSESEGGISRSYAFVAGSSSFVGSTYGGMLQWLIDTSRARFPVVLR